MSDPNMEGALPQAAEAAQPVSSITTVTEAPRESGQGIFSTIKSIFKRGARPAENTQPGSGLAEAIDFKPSIDSGTPMTSTEIPARPANPDASVLGVAAGSGQTDANQVLGDLNTQMSAEVNRLVPGASPLPPTVKTPTEQTLPPSPKPDQEAA